MKVLLSLILAMSAMGASAYSFKEVDSLLLENGYVNNNFKYVNDEAIHEFFRLVNNNVSELLPVDEGAYTITGIYFTPYVGNFFMVLNESLSKTEREAERKEFMHPDNLKEFCEISYAAKFQTANNFVVNHYFTDIDGNQITKVTLDRRVCPNVR